MYNLFACYTWKPSEKLTSMLNLVLGYTIEEINALENQNFGRNIVLDITLDKAKEISEIFYNNGYQLVLEDSDRDETVFWKNLGMTIKKDTPPDYNLSEPLVTRDHLTNVNVKPVVKPAAIIKPEQPKPKCPTCGSTNIKNISGTKRWLSTGIFGLASSNIGKTMQCNSCGYKF